MKKLQRLAPWLNRVVLALSVLVFARIGLRYLVDPVGAEAAVGGTLAAPMAITTARIGLGGFPIALALFNLTCLFSRRRFSAGVKLVAIVAFTAMAVRLYSAIVDGAVPQSTKLFLPESFIFIAALTALFLERGGLSRRASVHSQSSNP
jgi:hypothetical protein